MEKPQIRRIINLKQIEDTTGIPVNTLRSWRSSGEGFQTFRLGGRVVAYEDDVWAWVESQYAAAKAERSGTA